MSDKPDALKEYTIATVGDFLKVPADRQAACLTEFADFLDMARDLSEMVKIMGEIVGAEVESLHGPFIWTDDGKRNRTIVLTAEPAAKPAKETP